MAPSLGLINLLERLTELKRNMSLARLLVYYQKKICLRNSQLEEMHRAKGGKGGELPCPLPGCHSP